MIDRKRMVEEIVEAVREVDRLRGGAGDLYGDFSSMPDAMLVVTHAGVLREAAWTREAYSLQADIEAYAASGRRDPATEGALWERVRAAKAAEAQDKADFAAAMEFKQALAEGSIQ
jgi:hypothetical protein